MRLFLLAGVATAADKRNTDDDKAIPEGLADSVLKRLFHYAPLKVGKDGKSGQATLTAITPATFTEEGDGRLDSLLKPLCEVVKTPKFSTGSKTAFYTWALEEDDPWKSTEKGLTDWIKAYEARMKAPHKRAVNEATAAESYVSLNHAKKDLVVKFDEKKDKDKADYHKIAGKDLTTTNFKDALVAAAHWKVFGNLKGDIRALTNGAEWKATTGDLAAIEKKFPTMKTNIGKNAPLFTAYWDLAKDFKEVWKFQNLLGGELTADGCKMDKLKYNQRSPLSYFNAVKKSNKIGSRRLKNHTTQLPTLSKVLTLVKESNNLYGTAQSSAGVPNGGLRIGLMLGRMVYHTGVDGEEGQWQKFQKEILEGEKYLTTGGKDPELVTLAKAAMTDYYTILKDFISDHQEQEKNPEHDANLEHKLLPFCDEKLAAIDSLFTTATETATPAPEQTDATTETGTTTPAPTGYQCYWTLTIGVVLVALGAGLAVFFVCSADESAEI